jgi:pentatricopeptide repeat protein
MMPDEEDYTTLINGYLQLKKWRYAWEIQILERMLNTGHQPGTEAFHLVLAGLLNKMNYLKKLVDRWR